MFFLSQQQFLLRVFRPHLYSSSSKTNCGYSARHRDFLLRCEYLPELRLSLLVIARHSYPPVRRVNLAKQDSAYQYMFGDASYGESPSFLHQCMAQVHRMHMAGLGGGVSYM